MPIVRKAGLEAAEEGLFWRLGQALPPSGREAHVVGIFEREADEGVGKPGVLDLVE